VNDYEMLNMTEQFVNTTWTIFATYVSIVFAFLVASYLVADKSVWRRPSPRLSAWCKRLIPLWVGGHPLPRLILQFRPYRRP
jgi:hypothetical protein